MNQINKEEIREISEEEAAAESEKYAADVCEDTVDEIIDKEDGVKSRFAQVGALKKYWDDICLVFPLLKDWTSQKYTKAPWSVIATLAGSIVYVLSPIDLCPDIIPVAGYLDDATLFGFVISLAKDHLEKYKAWKKND